MSYWTEFGASLAFLAYYFNVDAERAFFELH